MAASVLRDRIEGAPSSSMPLRWQVWHSCVVLPDQQSVLASAKPSGGYLTQGSITLSDAVAVVAAAPASVGRLPESLCGGGAGHPVNRTRSALIAFRRLAGTVCGQCVLDRRRVR